MTVPFARVPDNLRVGLFFVEFDNSMANNATATQRTLLIGGMLSTGSTPPGIPQRVSSSDTVGELAGKGDGAETQADGSGHDRRNDLRDVFVRKHGSAPHYDRYSPL